MLVKWSSEQLEQILHSLKKPGPMDLSIAGALVTIAKSRGAAFISGVYVLLRHPLI